MYSNITSSKSVYWFCKENILNIRHLYFMHFILYGRNCRCLQLLFPCRTFLLVYPAAFPAISVMQWCAFYFTLASVRHRGLYTQVITFWAGPPAINTLMASFYLVSLLSKLWCKLLILPVLLQLILSDKKPNTGKYFCVCSRFLFTSLFHNLEVCHFARLYVC